MVECHTLFPTAKQSKTKQNSKFFTLIANSLFGRKQSAEILCAFKVAFEIQWNVRDLEAVILLLQSENIDRIGITITEIPHLKVTTMNSGL